MQINGAPIPDDILCALVEELRPLADRMADPPTEFEPVSYTHLDVYKRQALTAAQRTEKAGQIRPWILPHCLL